MKKLLKNLWLFPVIIITALGIRAVIHSESLVDLNVTGGISANDNPVTLNNGLLIKGANTEFRNASYDVFGTTVSGGTKYFDFTPTTATFNQNILLSGTNEIRVGAGPHRIYAVVGDDGLHLKPKSGGNIKFDFTSGSNFFIENRNAAVIYTFTETGNMTTAGDIALENGGSITTTANGDITFTPNGTGDVNWTSQNSTMTTAGVLTTAGTITAPNFSVGSNGVYAGTRFAGVMVSSSITNTTAEITLYSVTIPANTLGAFGAIRTTSIWENYGAGGNKTAYVYLGSTNLGRGSTNVASWRSEHTLFNKGATNSQVAHDEMKDTGSGSYSLTGSIDTTQDTTYSLRGKMDVATDTMTLVGCFIEILK